MLATIDVDEGEDEQDGGEIEITSISRPDGVSVSDAEDLVEIFGTTLRLAGDIAPDDMPDGTYVFEISYGPGDDELIGEAPEPVTFTLTVGDINEQPTAVTITTQTGYVHENNPANNAASIDENTDTTGGLFLARLRWHDEDTGPDVTNRNVLSVPNNDYFEIRNGDELWLRAGVDLKHEEDDRLEVVITVEDDTAELGTPATQRFILHITDVDEQPTEFSAPRGTDVAENRRGEDEIKLADITVQDQDRVSGHRENVVTITGVVDEMGRAITAFADLFEVRRDGDQWDLFLTDPSQIDFEAVQRYVFTLALDAQGATDGTAPDDITFTLEIENSVLNADKTQSFTLAELQRDGFELVVTDPGDLTIQAGDITTDGRHIRLSEGTDENLFELVDEDDNGNPVKSLRLKSTATSSLTRGTFVATILLIHNQISIALADNIFDGNTISSIDNLADEAVISEVTGPASISDAHRTVTVNIGTDRYIVFRSVNNMFSTEAVTEAELLALTQNEYAIVTVLNTDGTIARQQQIAGRDIFTPPQIDQQVITLVVSHTPISGVGTEEADDNLGHEDHTDSVSYSAAGAQTREGYLFGVQIDLNSVLQSDAYDDMMGVTGISNGWAAGDRLTSIEEVIGSVYRDHIIGNDADNRLSGNLGDDILQGGAGDDWLQGGAGRDEMTGGSGTDRFEVELGDGQRAADIITDFTTNDRLVLTNPDRANNPRITDYGSLADLLEAASLRLEADSTDTDDLNLIYNPDPDNQADEVVLVLDEFLATNDLDDITLTQIELL